MFERFTEKAIKVIMLAQEESRRLGHNFVGTEQMLLGLIGEGTGIAAKSLKSMGVTLKDARVEVEKIIGRGSGFVAVEIPFTPRAKRALENSWNEAQLLGHNYIGTEHLLLGLTVEQDEHGVAIRVLQNLHVDVKALRRIILSNFPERGPVNLGSLPAEPLIPSDAKDLTYSGGAFEWYSVAARHTVTDAKEASYLTGSAAIEPEHIFLSLLNDDSTIRSAMQSLPVATSDLRRHLLQFVKPGDSTPSDSIPFSEATQDVLKHAWLKAVELEQPFITRESLLLGLLSNEDGVAMSILRTLAADPEKLRGILIETAKAEVQKAKTAAAAYSARDDSQYTSETNKGQQAKSVDTSMQIRLMIIAAVVAMLAVLASISHR